MTQDERRIFLIKYLLDESAEYKTYGIPSDIEEQKKLLRGLMNVRMPGDISDDFLTVQDEYLKEAINEKGVTDYKNLKPVEENIYLWKGDITTLKCDAIVNAANSGMTGCYIPNHNCIDNFIHTYAGVKLRKECDDIMRKQGHEEECGKAKITNGYNLPAKYVIHTVGPIINTISDSVNIKNNKLKNLIDKFDYVSEKDRDLLKSCYISCLNLAKENNLKSIAFCCISTGVFSFPNELASLIAVKTVREYLKEYKIDVIFNVFKDIDYDIYTEVLKCHQDYQ